MHPQCHHAPGRRLSIVRLLAIVASSVGLLSCYHSIPLPYTVSYTGNGSTGGSAPATGLYYQGMTVTVANNTGGLTRTNGAFARWNTSADGVGTGYIAGDTFTMGAADVVLYAVWDSAGSAAVSFSYSLAGEASVSVTSGSLRLDKSTSETLAITASVGSTYTFGAWYLDGSTSFAGATASGTILTLDSSLLSLGTHTVMATVTDGSGGVYSKSLAVKVVNGWVVTTMSVSGTCSAFSSPYGMAIDPTGSYLYVADSGNYRIVRVTISTGETSLVAGSGTSAYLDSTSASTASFVAPYNVAVDPTGGTLYVTDLSGTTAMIRAIDLGTGAVSTLTSASIGEQFGQLAIDPTGSTLYCSAESWSVISTISTSSGTMDTFSSSVSGSTALAIDSAGTYLYCYNSYDAHVYRIAISSGSAESLAALPATPYGLALDAQERYLYVTDFSNNTILKIDISAKTMTTLAGTGVGGSTDAVASQATFSGPAGMAASSTTIFVVDTGNNAIRELQ